MSNFSLGPKLEPLALWWFFQTYIRQSPLTDDRTYLIVKGDRNNYM